ncbi:MAG: hypothetical protein KAW89_04370 [Armatimonadetes bacterium]|nr:hypothetical protein [Armatimonadota bacterium]
MVGYEKVKWQSDSFSINVDHMLLNVTISRGTKLHDEIEEIAHAPGPLHVALARSNDVGRAYPSAKFYANLIDNMGAPSEGNNGQCIVELLSPFLRWDYGIYGLIRGLGIFDWTNGLQLLDLHPENRSDLVEVIWLTGLLAIAGFADESRCAAERVKRAYDDAGQPRRICKQVIAEAGKHIDQFAEQCWDIGPRPTGWNPHRVRLWHNAVVMAKHHHPDPCQKPLDSQQVFRHLLAHVVRDGKWPLDCEANHKLEEQYDEVASFKAAVPVREVPDVLGGTATVRFQSDPLEILNVGNVFGTCLRLASKEDESQATAKLLGCATNVNVRLITVSAEDGRMLARRTIGLSLEEPVGVLQCPTYPGANPEFKKAIDDFVDDFLERTMLEKVYGRKVKETCAEPYNNHWLPEA